MINPFVIVGLGNIGREYDNTRHNVGFYVLDLLASLFEITQSTVKFNGEIQTVSYNLSGCNLKGYLIKPHTFMNLSGECVRPFIDYYKIPVSNVLIIHDDVDLKNGQMKFKCGGGDAGHNGLKSLTSHLNTNKYYRLRIGVDRPQNKSYDMINWVLGRLTNSEKELIEKQVALIKKHFDLFLSGNIARFQERINTK